MGPRLLPDALRCYPCPWWLGESHTSHFIWENAVRQKLCWVTTKGHSLWPLRVSRWITQSKKLLKPNSNNLIKIDRAFCVNYTACLCPPRIRKLCGLVTNLGGVTKKYLQPQNTLHRRCWAAAAVLIFLYFANYLLMQAQRFLLK